MTSAGTSRKVSPKGGSPDVVLSIGAAAPDVLKAAVGAAGAAAGDSQHKSQASKYRSTAAEWLRARGTHLRRHLAKERVLLRANLRVVVLGLMFQWVHSTATNVVYMLHVQRQPLYDLGFEVLPPLSRDWQIISELVFFAFIAGILVFALTPLVRERKGPARYIMTLVARYIAVLMLCQALRIMSFMATVLPGPNYHCRPGSLEYAPPQTAADVFARTDAFKGCGDLVFSSHTIFVMTCALTYQRYGSSVNTKRLMWAVVFVFGLLVVAARKHYTLDVVVAWYTVPLVWVAYERYFPDRFPRELIEMENADREAAAAAAKAAKIAGDSAALPSSSPRSASSSSLLSGVGGGGDGAGGGSAIV